MLTDETGCPTGGLSVVVGYHGTDESSQQVENNMKLFAVRLPDGSLMTDTKGQPVYFDDKKEAKRVRDRHESAVVVLGPDHARYDD